VKKNNSKDWIEFEKDVKNKNREYRLNGEALISKNNLPTTWGGNIIGNALPDYSGVIKGGRYIVYDCKSTVLPRLELRNITQEQMNYLLLAETLGSVSGIFAKFVTENTCFWIPINYIISESSKSIKLSQIPSAYEVSDFDYLSIIKKLYHI